MFLILLHISNTIKYVQFMYMSFKTSTKVLKFTMCTCVFIKKIFNWNKIKHNLYQEKKRYKKTSIILIEFILIYIIYLERFETFVCKSVAFKFFFNLRKWAQCIYSCTYIFIGLFWALVTWSDVHTLENFGPRSVTCWTEIFLRNQRTNTK